jgi:hypothetical protein
VFWTQEEEKRREGERKEKNNGLRAFQTRMKCPCSDSWILLTLFIFKDLSETTKRTRFSVTRLCFNIPRKGMSRARSKLRVSNTWRRTNVTNKVTLFAEVASAVSYLKMLRALPSQVAHGSPHGRPAQGYFSHQAGVSALRASFAVCHSSTFTVWLVCPEHYAKRSRALALFLYPTRTTSHHLKQEALEALFADVVLCCIPLTDVTITSTVSICVAMLPSHLNTSRDRSVISNLSPDTA